MSLSDEFEHLSLDAFESDNASEEYSFVGLSVDSRVTDALYSTEAERSTQSSQHVTVERFLEECCDAGVQVFPESSFEKQSFLGSGATMDVYKSRWKDRGQLVALKYFRTPVWSQLLDSANHTANYHRLLEACMLELRVLTEEHIKRHENVAKLLGVSWHPNGNSICPILIMELACEEHRTLKEYLCLPTSLKTRFALLRDVLEGLSALHAMDVVHGDIKPENVLMFKSTSAIGLSARLSDFGFCRPTADYKWEAGGTPYWNAPECLSSAPAELRTEAYGKRRDLYSLGLLACNLLTKEMPFDSADIQSITQLKLQDKVAALIKAKIDNKISSSSVAIATFIDIIGRMLALHPNARPTIDEIRTALEPWTSDRVTPVTQHAGAPDRLHLRTTVLQTRYNTSHRPVGDLGGHRNLDSSLPRELKVALCETLMRVASTGNSQERARAMNRLGVFFLNGFGTSKSYQHAFTWFCKAANEGSIEARKMVFRMERATDNLPEPVYANIEESVRVTWMIHAVMDTMRAPSIDPRMVPEGMNVETYEDKIRQTLASIDPAIVRHGLVRDVEHNVIRLMAFKASSDVTRNGTLENVELAAKASPQLFLALEHALTDNADALDDLITKNHISKPFLDRLVTVTSDYGCRRALRTLCVKHGADPNYVDHISGRKSSPMLTAGLSMDYYTVTALSDCGADILELLKASYAVVNHGASNIMSILLQMIEVQAASDFIDGVFPDMNGRRYTDGDITEHPPDNQNPPPLFYAVLFNRLDKLFALLSRGANPNVRFGGWTAMHLAVRMLHPCALLFLLAFGGDPNARNSREAYTTPLHTLSEVRLRLPDDSAGDDIQTIDFLFRPYRPLPVRTGDIELVQRQALIVRILLACGADANSHCLDGFTPLMNSVVTNSPDAKSLLSVLLGAKFPLDGRSSRDETILHICSLENNSMRLEQVLAAGAKELVNAKDRSRCTPLLLACLTQGSGKVVRILLEHGSDVSLRGVRNLSVFDAAFLSGDWESVGHLITHTSHLPKSIIKRLFNTTDDDRRNILHFCLASEDVTGATARLSRLLSLMEADLVVSLVRQRDKDGYTPYHLAYLRGNTTACRELTSNYGAPSQPSQSDLRAVGAGVATLEDVMQFREMKMQAESTNANNLMDECEYTGPKRRLTSTERRLQSDLEKAIQSEGEDSPRAIWCMNTLGTVHERFGRLQKAQDLYHRGWQKSLHTLGPVSPLTKDTACKLLRVLRDRGLEAKDIPHIANWHALNGTNTLREGISLWSEADQGPLPKYEAAKAAKTQLCARNECNKDSTLACNGCNYVRYCSDSCRVLDVIDPKVQHLSACLPVEVAELSHAIRIEDKITTHGAAREMVQKEWDRVRRSTQNPAPEIAPRFTHMATGMLTPRFFKKPVVHVAPKNSLIMFTNTGLFETRYEMRGNSDWVRGGTAIAIKDMEFVIRPSEAAVQQEAQAIAGGENEEVMVWIEVTFDCDFQALWPDYGG